MWFNGIWCQFFEEAVEGGDLGGEAVDTGSKTVDTGSEGADTSSETLSATLSTGNKGSEKEVPADWPADWRAKISTDAKHSKTLDRFASPKAVYESYVSLRQKLDSGELKPVTEFPTKGTPEQQAEWREAHGIPAKADDYKLKFPDGLVIGENDKQFVENFMQVAHKSNATPEQVNQMLHWYYEEQERILDAQEEKDAQYMTKSEDILRAEWGGEYRTNINVIKGLVNTLPEGVRGLFMNARLGDGNALLNHPDMARWLVHTAKTVNPVATVVPGAGANVSGAIDDEITKIEKVMREDRKTYNSDEKMQKRLRDLYGARERAK